jgi:hypothetical protein
MLRQIESSPDSGVYRTHSRRLRRDERNALDSADYVLKVAWPVFLRPVRQSAPVTLVVAGKEGATFGLSGDISDAIIADYRRQRLMLLTRTVARAVVKYAATEAAERKKGEAGKTIASIAGSVLEHADTRSWHLLPADIALTRMTLPPGRHHLAMRVGAPGDSSRVIDLGDVEITAGGIAFVSARVWPDLPAMAAVAGH